ncbi:hypothetical protein BLL52_2864 [Rhodoferax antarcticus ANT.BR]|uniref:Uncharacterized protein n=1 Tax=Rhodoferax antarcticus ANT.BR TaxID=1111071 RepID=A0A1Q8YF14_9BURK|nr:hypothetical protein BLL52_2864 [Rhodoferax antarcticus ANT.BR]
MSPARCAASSLTYAKRTTRLIFSERFGTLAGASQQWPAFDRARMDVNG